MADIELARNLGELIAERDRLDRIITEIGEAQTRVWNTGLDDCEAALHEWLLRHEVQMIPRNRKNELIWDIGNGSLKVTFGTDGEDRSRGLRAESAGGLTVEWSEMPESDRFVAIVTAVLGEKADA